MWRRREETGELGLLACPAGGCETPGNPAQAGRGTKRSSLGLYGFGKSKDVDLRGSYLRKGSIKSQSGFS